MSCGFRQINKFNFLKNCFIRQFAVYRSLPGDGAPLFIRGGTFVLKKIGQVWLAACFWFQTFGSINDFKIPRQTSVFVLSGRSRIIYLERSELVKSFILTAVLILIKQSTPLPGIQNKLTVSLAANFPLMPGSVLTIAVIVVDNLKKLELMFSCSSFQTQEVLHCLHLFSNRFYMDVFLNYSKSVSFRT